MRMLPALRIARTYLLCGGGVAQPQSAALAPPRTPQDAPPAIAGKSLGEAAYQAVLDRVAEWQRRHQARVLWLQPLVNPDGVVAQQRQNANHVDLNRNFSARWQAGGDAECDYGGTAAFSEAETRAVRDFLSHRIHLRAYLDFHRDSRVLIPAQSGPEGVVDATVGAVGTALNKAMDDYSPALNEAMDENSPLEQGENRSEASYATQQDPRWLGVLHLLEHAADQEAVAVTVDDDAGDHLVAPTKIDCESQSNCCVPAQEAVFTSEPGFSFSVPSWRWRSHCCRCPWRSRARCGSRPVPSTI